MGGQTSKPSVYARSQLTGRMIRLLFISPSSDPQRQLECHCCPYEIDDAPQYEALSYVWGATDPASNVAILFNDEEITIGSGLAVALTRLRRTNEMRIVWADGLCIDQSNNLEKSLQVPMMGSIYSMARRTVVWLGNGDPEMIKVAMNAVRIIADACNKYASTHTIGTTTQTRYRAVNLPSDLFDSGTVDSLQVLYGLPWFWRVWCIQEICLAQDAIVLWGPEEVPWLDVRTAAHWIFDKTTPQDPNDPVVPILQRVNTSHADMMTDAQATQLSLLDALRNFRERNATDPRDKVYGLLSLVTPKEAATVPVNYNSSVGQVYAGTVFSIIQLHSRLTALAFVSHPRDYRYIDQMPSWAPNWSDWRLAMNIGYPEKGCPFRASAGELVRESDMKDMGSPELPLTGILYETVSDVQDVNFPILLEFNYLGDIHPFVTAMKMVSAMENPEKQWHKLARTLNAGEAASGYYISELDEADKAAFYGGFIHLMAKMRGASEEELKQYEEYPAASINFRDGAFITSTFRRVFLMSNGSFGMGPQCMAPGDMVVVLYGGNTPYVIRPCGERYLFMGQAYVDEVMNGEMVQEVKEGKREEQRFRLI